MSLSTRNSHSTRGVWNSNGVAQLDKNRNVPVLVNIGAFQYLGPEVYISQFF